MKTFETIHCNPDDPCILDETGERLYCDWCYEDLFENDPSTSRLILFFLVLILVTLASGILVGMYVAQVLTV